jgi:outer membrane protein
VLWAAAPDEAALAAVPSSLAAATARAATSCAITQWKAVGMIPPSVSVLVEGALNAMFVTRMKLAAIACACLAAGTVSLARSTATAPDEKPRPAIPVGASTVSDGTEPAHQDVPAATAVTTVGDEGESDAEAAKRAYVEQLSDEAEVYRNMRRKALQSSCDESDEEKAVKAKKRYGDLCDLCHEHTLKLAAARRDLAEARKRRIEAAKAAEPKAEAPGPQAPAPRIGSVDVVAVYQGYEKAKVADEKYQAAARAREPRTRRLQDELKDASDQLRKLAPGTDDHRKQKARVAEITAQGLVAYEEGKRASDEREARDTVILLEIERVVARLAKAKGLSYVLKVSPQPGDSARPADVQEALKQSILYADPANDLTQEVIRELNRKSKEEATKPAAN